MTDRATTLKTAIVDKAQGLAWPVTHTAMRATLGVVIVLAVSGHRASAPAVACYRGGVALWYAKTAIFLALAGIL
jgi:hypothetical protein